VSQLSRKRKKTFEKRKIQLKYFKDVKAFRSRDLSLDQNIKYSHEVNKLFEKSG
jgi:hypothetical protein